MCGITGLIDRARRNDELGHVLESMTDRLEHRGPDDRGTWVGQAEDSAIGLGQRRLAIIDLSPAGHQPMQSHCGRYVIVYNGEIYNFRTLRADLDGEREIAWRGHSDTEVLLAAISTWGLEATLPKLNGMFAIALWDKRHSRLFLARDRFGEKPLYYGKVGSTFLFGSELKALKAHPDFRADIDRDAVSLYLRHNYIPAPHSIWRGIYKLEPAHLVEISSAGDAGRPQPFWSFDELMDKAAAHPVMPGSGAVDELEQVLSRSIGLRMEADVPLGAFLSGGIDSSLIVALMQKLSPGRVKTFTIGFDQPEFNEADVAKQVAQHLGTNHFEHYLQPHEALDLVPRLPEIWDEPFADSSQIPTYLVSMITRQHVTVALSGDAGDELFGGYNRYFLANRINQATRWMPDFLRPAFGTMMRKPGFGALVQAGSAVLPRRFRHSGVRDRLPKIADVIEAGNSRETYRQLVSHFKRPDDLVIGGHEPATLLNADTGIENDTLSMMYLDTLTYLPGDILAKVDRASMAVSLESRIPFLDPDVVEFAWRLPLSAKVQGGSGKRILKELLYRHVPAELIDRPKMGFGVPLDEWLAGPLKSWADDLLAPDRLKRDGIFEPAPIIAMWEEHRSGRRRWPYHLWDILMFQAWHDKQGMDSHS